MEASRETFVVLPVSQYKQLQNKYEVHLKNITEEERRRRRWVAIRCVKTGILLGGFVSSTQTGGGSFL